jgi:hypothetical protein
MSQEMPGDPLTPSYGVPPDPYAAPPQPQSIREQLTEPPKMSPFARLFNIFFSPGEVFEDVRRSPRDWWLPVVVLSALVMGTTFFVQSRLGMTPEVLGKAAIDLTLKKQNKTRKDLSPQEKDQFEKVEKVQAVMQQFIPFFIPVGFLLMFAIGAGFYRLLALIVGFETTYFRLFSVMAYSYFAPITLKCILSVLVALGRKPGDIDPEVYLMTRDVVAAGPAAFISQTEHPALRALASNFDVFNIWVAVLIAIGLAAASRKLSIGTASMIVGGIFLFWMVVSTGMAAAF